MAEPWTDDDILSGRVMLLLSEAPTPADAERIREFMGRLVPTLLRLRGERDEARRERYEARQVARVLYYASFGVNLNPAERARLQVEADAIKDRYGNKLPYGGAHG
jgi:hypothetical protein